MASANVPVGHHLLLQTDSTVHSNVNTMKASEQYMIAYSITTSFLPSSSTDPSVEKANKEKYTSKVWLFIKLFNMLFVSNEVGYLFELCSLKTYVWFAAEIVFMATLLLQFI